MKTIPLSKGYVAIVDDDDFAAVSVYKWCAQVSHWGAYAKRTVKKGGRKKCVMLHKEIFGSLPPGMLVDHINGDTLDNRRANLRAVNKYEHAQNTAKRSDNSSGHRGVSFCRFSGKWRAEISANGRRVRIGRFDSVEKAAAAYRDFAERMHGEFSGLARSRYSARLEPAA